MSTVGIDINAATTTPKMERSAPGVTAQNERTRLNEVTGKILQTDWDLLWGEVKAPITGIHAPAYRVYPMGGELV